MKCTVNKLTLLSSMVAVFGGVHNGVNGGPIVGVKNIHLHDAGQNSTATAPAIRTLGSKQETSMVVGTTTTAWMNQTRLVTSTLVTSVMPAPSNATVPPTVVVISDPTDSSGRMTMPNILKLAMLACGLCVALYKLIVKIVKLCRRGAAARRDDHNGQQDGDTPLDNLAAAVPTGAANDVANNGEERNEQETQGAVNRNERIPSDLNTRRARDNDEHTIKKPQSDQTSGTTGTKTTAEGGHQGGPRRNGSMAGVSRRTTANTESSSLSLDDVLDGARKLAKATAEGLEAFDNGDADTEADGDDSSESGSSLRVDESS